MLIFTFRLHGLIEVTPCGNIAGAMALNRGARPISSFSFWLPTTTSSTPLPLVVLHSLLFCLHCLSCRFFIIDLFSALLFSLPTVLPAASVTLNSISLTGCYFAYLPHAAVSHGTATGWHYLRSTEIRPAIFFQLTLFDIIFFVVGI